RRTIEAISPANSPTLNCTFRTGCSLPSNSARFLLFHLTSKQKLVYSIGMSNKTPAKADVLQGTLDLMVLQNVATLGPVHGYMIAARLEQVSAGALRLNMGTLYPALMRLEQRGLLRGEWGVTDNNRKARFYSITAAGRRQLATERAE